LIAATRPDIAALRHIGVVAVTLRMVGPSRSGSLAEDHTNFVGGMK